MPRVTIDQRSIQVPEGTKIITAAEQLGIMIPRFCFHPGLGAVGACRVCAVKFMDGPVKGIQMSCMIDCHDGMVVSTTDDEAVDFRRHVIEWLMLHHPHDCPVCDEGGHCLLQDMTVSGGHGRRRYAGPKRTHVDQYMGPLLQHEMNRCIQCYRCSRFYQEYCGYRDLGVLGIANRVYFGRYKDGILENPFCGNLADICPTGVFTDKPSRYQGRRWDYERTPSVCIGCSLGCHTVVSARYRSVVRQEARHSETVNGHFICDRGRHGYVYAGSAQRPRRALVDKRPTEPAQALTSAAGRLREQVSRHGPGSIGLWGSPRSDLQTLAALKQLAAENSWPAPAFFDQTDANSVGQACLAVLDARSGVPLQSVAGADFILAVGVDPLAEAPMLALAIRQAARRDAPVVVLDPRPQALPFPATFLAAAPAQIGAYLEQLNRALADRSGNPATRPPESRLDIGDLAGRIMERERPVIVYGCQILDQAAVRQCGLLADALARHGLRPGLFPVLPGANAMAAALLSDPRMPAEVLLRRMESGDVRSLIVVEHDPLWQFYDRRRLESALDNLELLIVMDYLDSRIKQRAHIFFATTTVYENDGIFINQEGRAQRVAASFQGGQPLVQTGGGGHPPRVYAKNIPGGEPRPAWQLLNALGSSDPADPETAGRPPLAWLADYEPVFAPLAEQTAWPSSGIVLHGRPRHLADIDAEADSRPAERPQPADQFELISIDLLYGSEILSCQSPQLAQLETPPFIGMAAEDARSLGLSHGDQVRIKTGRGSIEAALAISEKTAEGCLLLPRHHRMAWQQLTGLRQSLPVGRIRKL